ncbi:MAG: 3-isopropylmalate dehydrogenase [Verrucomicrobiota bacterium]
MSQVIEGPAYVVRQNIDTDQIIPAQYLTLVPTIPEEYEKLGAYALIGLPDDQYPVRYVEEGKNKTEFEIVVAGRNFGCGSSREHAPIALGAAGCQVVLAESYARIFFRNCVATGELIPCELEEPLADKLQTGDSISVDLEKEEVTTPHGKVKIKPLGEIKPVIDAGGIFEFARQSGMVPTVGVGWAARSDKKHRIAVLPGDGIGPEVMEAALPVITLAAEKHGVQLEIQEELVGGAAIDAKGTALPDETLMLCDEADAILFGSVGGPKWEQLPPHEQPERAALLPLRKEYGLYANLRPAVCYPQLTHASPLKESILRDGFDVMVVRELTGGIYFGKPKETTTLPGGKRRAIDTLVYTESEIERIAHVACKAAQLRHKRVTLVDKANVLESSVLWREVVTRVVRDHPDVTLDYVYVDNAAMQVVRDPSQYDVLLCENMFGDIISDELAAVAGSLGLLPSASINDDSFGLYEPSGGSAPDIAGQGVANPIAQILSGALMLRYSCSLPEAAADLERAVGRALEDGFRTADIYTEGTNRVGTHAMAEAITDRLK